MKRDYTLLRVDIGFAVLLALVVAVACYAQPVEPLPTRTDNEATWSRWLATEMHAESQHQLFNRKRVDILTDKYAIEVEWCDRRKVGEAVRQAIYYATATGREPAIVLLIGKLPVEDRWTYELFVEAASENGIKAVSVLDVTSPDVSDCCNHLGIVAK